MSGNEIIGQKRRKNTYWSFQRDGQMSSERNINANDERDKLRPTSNSSEWRENYIPSLERESDWNSLPYFWASFLNKFRRICSGLMRFIGRGGCHQHPWGRRGVFQRIVKILRRRNILKNSILRSWEHIPGNFGCHQ